MDTGNHYQKKKGNVPDFLAQPGFHEFIKLKANARFDPNFSKGKKKSRNNTLRDGIF
jgi:hypothetical protein